MQRVGGYRLRGAELHKFAKVHYRNAVAYIAQHVKVVRYNKIGQAELLLQIEQQIEYLRLNGYVKGACGFIQHHYVGPEHQRACNGYTLKLTAGKLMRIGIEIPFIHLDQLHGLLRLFNGLRLGNAVQYHGAHDAA